jgi:hypothetical protein
LGDCSKLFVREGNKQMTICALIYFMSFLVQNKACYETPANGRMPLEMPLCNVFKFTMSTRVHIWLGAYGAETAKPLQIFSTEVSVLRLKCVAQHAQHVLLSSTLKFEH